MKKYKYMKIGIASPEEIISWANPVLQDKEFTYDPKKKDKVSALRPIAFADEPVKSLSGEKGLMYLNGEAKTIDDLWKNGTSPAAYWLWERERHRGR